MGRDMINASIQYQEPVGNKLARTPGQLGEQSLGAYDVQYTTEYY